MNKKTKIILIILFCIHLILLTLVLSNKLNSLFNDATLRKGKAADFFAVYQAGNNILEGKSLYLDTEGISTPYSYPYRYLPFIGYSIGVLFNLLAPFTAYYLWIFINELLLLFNLYLTWKLSKSNKTFILASIPWFIFSPYLLEMYMGQCSFLMTSLIFYSIYGLINKSKLIYSYLLAPLVKPNALILSPLFLRLKKFKLLLLNALIIILTSSIYFLFFKEDINIFLKNFSDSWYSHGGNLGFKSLYYLIFIRYLNIPLPRLWFFGFIITFGLMTLYFTFKYKDIILTYTLWICYFFLIYKDVWEHHYVLLMPVFSLLIVKYKLTINKLFSKKFILIPITFLLISLPSIFALQYFFNTGNYVEPDTLNPLYVISYHSIKIFGVMILYFFSINLIK